MQLAAVALAVLSPAVGSFLAMLADRLPAGQDPLVAPSRCASCGARLGWAEMVPILSYLARRGHCGHCGAAIPGHLLRIELLAVAAAFGAIAVAENLPEMVFIAGWLWCLIALFYADLNHMRLPNALTLALLLLGLGLAWADPGHSVGAAALTALGASAAFWAIRAGYRRLRGQEGLGLGDVKLVAGIGAGLGPFATPLAILFAALIGLAAAAAEGWRSGRMPSRTDAIPFGAVLCAGAVLAFMLRFAP